MDASQSNQVTSNQLPTQLKQDTPVVPVSDQPLTLDPNNLSVPTQPPPAQVMQVNQPIVGGHKEAGPIIQAPVSEYVKQTETAPKIEPEVAEAGVEAVVNQEQPQLTSAHAAVGIQPAKEAVPVVVSDQSALKFPYSSEQAKEIEKKTPASESRHWLAVLVAFLMKRLQGGV